MIDYSALRTVGECDDANTRLDNELDIYQPRDVAHDAAERRNTRAEATQAQRLAEAIRDIASATATLALADLSDSARKAARNDLKRATRAKEDIEDRDEDGGGATDFMSTIKAARNDAYVAMLLEAKAGLPAHRATLSA